MSLGVSSTFILNPMKINCQQKNKLVLNYKKVVDTYTKENILYRCLKKAKNENEKEKRQ